MPVSSGGSVALDLVGCVASVLLVVPPFLRAAGAGALAGASAQATRPSCPTLAALTEHRTALVEKLVHALVELPVFGVVLF